MTLDDLIATADAVVKRTLAFGAEEAECYVSQRMNVEVEMNGNLVTASEGETLGAGIRATIGRKVGFAAISTVEAEKLYAVAERAVTLARIRPEDPKFRRLADIVRRPSKPGLYDERVQALGAPQLIDMSHRLLAEAQSKEAVNFVQGVVMAQTSAFAVVNSRGVNCGDRQTGMGAFVSCKAAGGGEEKTAGEEVVSRSLVALDGIGETAAERAIASLGSRRLEAIDLPVIFDSYTARLFMTLLGYGISARAVQENRSALEGKIGREVASANLTVVDDAQMPEGIRTAAYDDEGVPMVSKPIIEDGVLKTYLYDSYTANREDRQSTGNGLRQGRDSFRALPSPSPVNYHVKPGPKPLEAMIRESDRAVLARYELMGVGHSNRLTGDFSVVATNAFFVEKGEVRYPLVATTIAGNVYEALKAVIEVGSDLRLDDQGRIPSLKVGGLKCAAR